MALTQRFESYGSHHPRKTFAFGLTAGLTSGTGIVLAVALTIGMGGARSEGQFVASQVSQGVVATSSITDEQAYLAEQNYRAVYGTTVDTDAAAAAGLSAEFGTQAGPTEAMGMDPYGGFVEPSSSVVASGSVTGTPMRVSPSVDADTNAFDGAGLFAESGSQVGPQEAIGMDPYGGFVEPGPQAKGSTAATGSTAEGIVTASDITLTPELRAGMDDWGSGHPFAWVTPELRAGIEG